MRATVIIPHKLVIALRLVYVKLTVFVRLLHKQNHIANCGYFWYMIACIFMF